MGLEASRKDTHITFPESCNVSGLYHTVYPKKYAHGFCFAVLCYGYTLTDFPISIRLTSLALWQSNDCPSASKATLMNMDKYFMWIHYKRLHNHNKAKHNKTVCIFLGIYCISLLIEYASSATATARATWSDAVICTQILATVSRSVIRSCLCLCNQGQNLIYPTSPGANEEQLGVGIP